MRRCSSGITLQSEQISNIVMAEESGALDMGADGHYRFATLTKMAKYCPDLITDMLTPVVSRL